MSKLPYSSEHHCLESWTVDLAQDPSASTKEEYTLTGNVGVAYRCRESGYTLHLSGIAPVKVADGQTFTQFTPLKNDGSDAVVPALAGEAYVGYALQDITASSGDYVAIMINPGNLI